MFVVLRTTLKCSFYEWMFLFIVVFVVYMEFEWVTKHLYKQWRISFVVIICTDSLDRWSLVTLLLAYWWYCVCLVGVVQVSWSVNYSCCHHIFILPTGQCMFEYIQQPPSTTLNCCNPYQNGYITIVCCEESNWWVWSKMVTQLEQ